MYSFYKPVIYNVVFASLTFDSVFVFFFVCKYLVKMSYIFTERLIKKQSESIAVMIHVV